MKNQPQPSFIAQVTDISFKGWGVARSPEGVTVFIPGLWKGDKARILITSRKKRYAFAKVVEIITPSSHRGHRFCEYQGMTEQNCGGCLWQDIEYNEQLTQKENLVRSLLQREPLPMDLLSPIKPAPRLHGFRNRAQFHSEGKKVGFKAYQSHEVIDIKNCPILETDLNQKLTQLRTHLPQRNKISVSVSGAKTFEQGNTQQNEYFKQWVRERVHSWKTGSHLLELFCGSGNFTHLLETTRPKNLTAIEGSAEALKQLKRKKTRIVQTKHMNLFHKKHLGELGHHYDYLFLNPPREGYPYLSTLTQSVSALKEIIYISCDTPTCLSDIKKMMKQSPSWKIKEIQPVDTFPHTPHFEILVHLVNPTLT